MHCNPNLNYLSIKAFHYLIRAEIILNKPDSPL
jgi:hypothetical protein